ncbi:MAG: T9SS type A sorting domain-containing protein [Crocinitomicaceae bacterium]
MKNQFLVIKSFILGLSLLFSLSASAQFGNLSEYVAGNGLTTYSTLFQNPANFAPKATCGTVTRFSRYLEGQSQPISLPNNQSCNWVIRDGNGGSTTHYISQSQWNSAVGATYSLPSSNIKVSVNAINSTYIELLIERIDQNDCNTSVIGLDFQHSGSGGINALNTIEHTCDEGCGGIEPISCPVTGTIQSCCELECVKLTRGNSNPLCPTCYCVQVTFVDGTKASFDASFSQGEVVMHCYDKPIASYTIIERPESECNDCSSKGFSVKKNVEDNDQGINIFPNPTKNVFSIEGLSNDQITHVVVYNLSGQEVKAFDASREYSITELATGSYLIKVYKGETELASGRIIKK